MSDSTTKICTKCKTEYPATAEFWYQDKRNSDGLRYGCKICSKKSERKYREANPGKVRGATRKWQTANPGKVRGATRKWRTGKAKLPCNFSVWKERRAYDYFNGCCAVCKRQLNDLFDTHNKSMDHWIAVTDQRPDNPGTVATNMIPLCHGVGGCNNRKNDKDAREWLVQEYGTRNARVIIARVEQYFDWVREQDNS